MTESLFGLCARRIALITPCDHVDVLRTYLPENFCVIVQKIQHEVVRLKRTLPSKSPNSNPGIVDYPNKSDSTTHELPERCLIVDAKTLELDVDKSALAMEPFLNRLDFFDICAKLALDDPTERVYADLSTLDQEKLLQRDPVVWCRALELSPRRAILHYDDIALFCARQGLLPALERSLMKMRTILDSSLLQKCVLIAIRHGHFHIANRIRCDNYGGAFYAVFPDGHVPAHFFAQLLDRDKVIEEVGEQIATDLIEWLPKRDVQRYGGPSSLMPQFQPEC